MDKGSLKAQSCDCLHSMVLDSQVQALWHTLGYEPTARLAAMLKRFPSCFLANICGACVHVTQRDTSSLTLVRCSLEDNTELQHTILYVLKTLCSSETTVKLLVRKFAFTYVCVHVTLVPLSRFMVLRGVVCQRQV